MKALTLYQPWASLVAHGFKSIETRSWSTQYRGPVAIHASLRWTRQEMMFADEQLALGRLRRHQLPRGCVLATADLVDVVDVANVVDIISTLERSLGNFEPGRFAWILRAVRVLAEPQTARGALGLWNWEPAAVDA